MKYMRDGLPDSYGILELQDKILEIAKYIHDFCEEHEINYCLMGGSALGARRHGGFIPWDDDLDIFMTPDNFEKFRELFLNKGDTTKFYLQEYGKCKNGYVTVPKLRMNGTAYLEELTKDWDIHQGVFVDIFILHACPNSKIKQLWQCFWAKCAVIKGMSMRGYNRQKGLKKVLLSVSKVLPRKLMVDFALKQVYRYRNCKSDYLCNFLGKAVYKRGIYKRKWFENNKNMPFEKIELKVPGGLHEFLSERFGDYMTPPSEDRIKWEQHAVMWNTNASINEGGAYSDEYKLV